MKTTWMSIQALEGRFGVRVPGSIVAPIGPLESIPDESGLSSRFKALLALALCIAARRPNGIHDHLQAAVRAGASPRQILEVIETALLMSHDRAIRSGSRAASTFDDHGTT